MIIKEYPKPLIVASVTALPLFISLSAGAADLAALQELGERVFWDNISDPPRMACATCHDPRAGWTGSQSQTNRTQVAITGANPHTIGNRKPPSNAYASFSPPFGPTTAFTPTGVGGGVFWDGRAGGNLPQEPNNDPNKIGDEVFIVNGVLNTDLKNAYGLFRGPTAIQALGPFTNPVEQNQADRTGVCRHIQSSQYAELFERAWTVPVICNDIDVDVNYKRIAVALAAFQATGKVNSFSAKRDKALAAEADKKFPLNGLTKEENLGHDLFYTFNIALPGLPPLVGGPLADPNNPENTRAGNCIACHNSGESIANLFRPGAPAPSDGTEPHQLYTDFSYHNIGTPANPEIGQFDPANPDDGLSDTTSNANHAGHWKTPTLRNVDLRPNAPFVKAYAHNGFFKSLKGIMHFYNTATAQPNCDPALGVDTEAEALANNCWPVPEHPAGAAIGTPANPGFIGNLGLTEAEENAIVAYMKTFTDTKIPTKPKPFTPARGK